MNEPLVLEERQDQAAVLTLNRPAVMNSFNFPMLLALKEKVEVLHFDPEVRVVIITGAGEKAFCAGADLKERASMTEAQVRQFIFTIRNLFTFIEYLNKPVIAAVNGVALGGGTELALACDIRIAAEGSRFGIPAAKLGLGYAYDGIKKLIDLVGPAYAREIFYTARQFSAEEALRMGLINQLVPGEELESYVRNYCETIAANAPLTVRSVKIIVREALKDADARDMASCQRVVEECFQSRDYAEGRTAFMEKRKPVFKGR